MLDGFYNLLSQSVNENNGALSSWAVAMTITDGYNENKRVGTDGFYRYFGSYDYGDLLK